MMRIYLVIALWVITAEASKPVRMTQGDCEQVSNNQIFVTVCPSNAGRNTISVSRAASEGKKGELFGIFSAVPKSDKNAIATGITSQYEAIATALNTVGPGSTTNDQMFARETHGGIAPDGNGSIRILYHFECVRPGTGKGVTAYTYEKIDNDEASKTSIQTDNTVTEKYRLAKIGEATSAATSHCHEIYNFLNSVPVLRSAVLGL